LPIWTTFELVHRASRIYNANNAEAKFEKALKIMEEYYESKKEY